MNKQQWQSLYHQLADAHKQFTDSYATAHNGHTKPIKAQAQQQTSSIIRRVTTLIERHQQAYDLLTGDPDTHEYTRAIRYGEFRQPQYFANDLQDFLAKIQQEAERGE